GDFAAATLQVRVADARRASILGRGDHLDPGVPLGTVLEEPVDGQRPGLHLAMDHGHPGTPAGSGGAAMPTFQCQGCPPCTRRRHTTCSTSSYVPGISFSPGTGAPSKAMY